MQNNKEAVRLLILETSQNDAEDLVNLLRNAGRATQAQMIESPEQFAELLHNKTWDLCLAHTKCTEPSAFEIQNEIKNVEQDIPLILLSDNLEAQLVIDALEAGMKDAVLLEDKARLKLIILRELDNLQQRRSRRKAEIRLREVEKRCHLLLDSSRDAIAYVHDGMHIYANHTYIEMFGYADFEDLEGMPLMDMVVSDEQNEFKTFLKSYSEGKTDTDEFSFMGVRDDSSKFAAKMHFSPARYDGENCTQIIIRTGGESSETAETDSQDIITGLQNQFSFKNYVDKAIEKAAQSKEESRVLYIQLDEFIPIKNRVGASATNLILVDIARVLQQVVVAPNMLARIGDYSFAALVYGLDTQSVLALGDRICKEVAANRSEISGETVNITVSVGISNVNESTHDSAEIINKAKEAAAFITAHTGKGNAVQLHSTQEQSAAHDQQIMARLEDAIKNELFKLVFQPIVSLRGDSGEHYEILLRMSGDTGEDISPAEFLQTASNQGLSKEIDRWVIEQSISKLGAHLSKGHKTHLFINLTCETILDSTLLPWVSQLLSDARLPGDSVIFQISETDATAHLKEAKEFIKGANELQCKAAITHFGRALNPFNTLKHLPASFVKIDGSYVTELGNSEETKEELKTLVSSLHTQGILTVAPLVDSASLLPTLWQAGINYIQGYYIQQPSTAMDYDFSTEDDDE